MFENPTVNLNARNETHYAHRFIILAQHARYAEISTLTRVALSR